MRAVSSAVEIALAIMILAGSLCWLATMVSAFFFRARKRSPPERCDALPGVTILKPVCGLEKNLRENLRTACLQDYPSYQVVYSVQSPEDPAIPLLRDLQREFGSELVSVAAEGVYGGLNGKINNLVGAMRHARHDIMVISDSDVRLRPDYLRSIIAPFADPDVGAASTFFKAVGAGRWYEQMELLTINADHFAILMLTNAMKLTDFCSGASLALRREM